MHFLRLFTAHLDIFCLILLTPIPHKIKKLLQYFIHTTTHFIIQTRSLLLSNETKSFTRTMSMNVFKTQPHLKPQDAKTVDPSKLTALTPEVVSSIHAVNNTSFLCGRESVL